MMKKSHLLSFFALGRVHASEPQLMAQVPSMV